MGGPVTYVVRRQLRTGWASLAMVALLVGVVLGAAAAAGAAARRTSSAHSRFSEDAHAWDALYINYPDDGTAVFTAPEVEQLPGVEEAHQVLFDYAALGPGTAWLLDPSGRLGRELARSRVLEGRWFDPGRPEEVVISVALAEREHLEVGSRFPLIPPEYLEGDLSAEDAALVERLLDAVPGVQMRVVGVVAMPGALPPNIGPGLPLLQLSPAMAEFQDDEHTALAIRLADGASPEAFRSSLRQLGEDRGGELQLVLHRDLAEEVNRSLRPQVTALAALAVVLATAGSVIAAQAVARQTEADLELVMGLRGLGWTRGELVRAWALRWGAVSLGAGLVVALTAIALSPLSPGGLAGAIEPTAGVRFDPLVVLAAVAAATLLLVAVGAVSVLLRLRPKSAPAPRRRMSVFGGSPVLRLGARAAFDRGLRTARVPVWTTVGGVAVGIAAVVAALTVARTLDRQLDDPERYGLRWDVQLAQFTERTVADDGPPHLLADDRVDGLARGFIDTAEINGQDSTFVAMEPLSGDLRPPLVRGSYPEAADAVALGARTMRRLDVGIGDAVALDIDELGAEGVPHEIVGEVVLPAQGSGGRLDEGALVSTAGLDRLVADDEAPVELFVDLAPGADAGEVVDDLLERVEVEEIPSVISPPTPGDIVDLGRARSMPAAFAAALAVAGLAALAHTLVVAIRRRRRDVAVLRALGLDSRQLVGVAVVHGCLLAVVALLIGIPLGVATGRAGWAALADAIGSPLRASMPPPQLLVAVVGTTLAAATALSLSPGLRSAALRPGAVLRTE